MPPLPTNANDNVVHVTHVPQPTNSKRRILDPGRLFDKTSLTISQFHDRVNRDYAAHYFRWGFATSLIRAGTRILDVGCGSDSALARVLSNDKSAWPRCYVGVDIHRRPHHPFQSSWSQFVWQFDFTTRYGELGTYEFVTCFEVLEHMRKEDGIRLLRGLHACCNPSGQILLSTPVFNGKAAANHIYEWTIKELQETLTTLGLTVIARYGTFCSLPDLAKVATPGHLHVLKQLSVYYSHEVLANFLAPLYPDAARNNLWIIQPVEVE